MKNVFLKSKKAKNTIIGIKQTVMQGKQAWQSRLPLLRIKEQVVQQLLGLTKDSRIPVTDVASRLQLEEASDIAIGTNVIAITDKSFLCILHENLFLPQK